MKNYKNIWFISSLLLLSGCIPSSNLKKIQDRKDQITIIREEYSENSKNKLNEIATYSAGTDYSLNKIENPQVEVETAIELNNRIINLAGNPNLNDLDKIKETVDLLTSTIQSERLRGQQQLRERDQTILNLQTQLNEINSKYEAQIELLKKEATLVALKADQYEETIDEVNSYMGLGAIWYGLKKFISQGLIIIIIFILVFIALKFAANMNPIAASLFAIFEYLGGYIISIVKGILPNSTACINLVDSKYKTVLSRYVSLFEKLKLSNQPNNFTLEEIFKTFSSELNREDKNLITEIRQDLKNKI